MQTACDLPEMFDEGFFFHWPHLYHQQCPDLTQRGQEVNYVITLDAAYNVGLVQGTA